MGGSGRRVEARAVDEGSGGVGLSLRCVVVGARRCRYLLGIDCERIRKWKEIWHGCALHLGSGLGLVVWFGIWIGSR